MTTAPRIAPCCLALALILGACSDRPTGPGRPTDPRSRGASLRGAEGHPGKAESRRGYIYGRGGRPMAITYEVRHGLAIWEGDIVVGKAGEIAATLDELRASRAGPQVGRVRGGVVIDGDDKRWPNGVVPYVIDGGLSNPSRATDAMAEIELVTNGVTFVPRTNESDYIKFVDSDGCSSPVGRDGGAQEIKLGSGCTTGNAMHEVLHSLGMYHEHTRCDRDAFVTINWDNIEDDRSFNFDRQCDDATDYFDYDVGSIMHYGATFFSKNGQPTIELKVESDDRMGQRDSLSGVDIQTINFLYGSFNDAPTAAIAPLSASYDEGSLLTFDGSASSDPDDAVLTYLWDFGDPRCDVTPLPGACTAVSPTHVYVDDGSYTVTLTVNDGYATGSTSRTATVLNVAPTVNAGADVTVVSGQLVAFSGRFSDPGVEDDPWSWTIDWGFGAQSTGSTSSQLATITASRAACAAGTYSVVLTVTDKDGGVGTDSRTLTVPYYGVSIDVTPTQSPNAVSLSKKGLLPVSILSTATFDARSVNPATVVLGDESGTDTPVARLANGRYQARVDDTNGDGRPDLVVMFETAALVASADLGAATTQLVLRGFLADGCTNVRATDTVTPVP